MALQEDINTYFFHNTISIKQAYKKISYLRVNDEIVTNPFEIAYQVVNHFTFIFTGSNDMQDNVLIAHVILALVSNNTSNLITMMPLLEEIQN